jgi:prepilin signal peptidase PulO-like enzyme (type II secretory pathway)
MVFIIIIALLACGSAIIYQDMKTLNIDAWLIYLFTGISASSMLLASHSGVSIVEYIVAGAVAAFAGASIQFYFKRRLSKDALGEADVWLLASGGFLLGPFWLGQWIFIACAIAALLMLLAPKISGVRYESGKKAADSVLPFTPTIIATLIAMLVAQKTNIIDASNAPFFF